VLDYKIYHYENDKINAEIIHLYSRVFQVDFRNDFQWWYLDNPSGKSTCVVALDNQKVIAHWAVTPLPFNIMGNSRTELISLAAMVDPQYQGQGIFAQMGPVLLEYLTNNTNYSFIMGFPNDKSLRAHVKYLNYVHLRDYQFVRFPRGISPAARNYKLSDLPVAMDNVFSPHNLITLNRNGAYIRWRFGNKEKYQMVVDENQRAYIFTQYKNKIDILVWDYGAGEEDIIALSDYLYQTFNPESVCTWNSLSFDKYFPRDERTYHFCICLLNKNKSVAPNIMNASQWFLQMGDSELF